MTFGEKSAWASLVTTVLVFVPYFAQVLRLFVADQLEGGEVIGLFIGAVVAQIVLQVVIHIVLAAWGGKERTDERDLVIEAKSIRTGYIMYGATSMSLILLMLFLAAAPETPPQLLGVVWVSQWVLLCFVVSEVAKYLTQAICYRRGS